MVRKGATNQDEEPFHGIHTPTRVVTESEVECLDLPERDSIALSDLSVAAKQAVLALAVGVGLEGAEENFEEQVSDRASRQHRPI